MTANPKGEDFMPKQKVIIDKNKEINLEDLESYRQIAARGSEVRAFGDVINIIVRPRGDLNDQEIKVILEEVEAKSSMILMIFRFFLQSGEYPFFIRRLKNVVMTKASFKSFS